MRPVHTPPPPAAADLAALAAHLRLFAEALEAGDRHQAKRRAGGEMSAHAYLAHRALMEDAGRIARGQWGGRGALTGYARVYALTPTIAFGLGADGVAARLRDRGILDPHGVWRSPFTALPLPPP